MRGEVEIRRLLCEGGMLEYELARKPVKNLNLRIRPDGRICVSAHPAVPVRRIDGFVREKEGFILRAREGYAKKRREAELLPRESHREEELLQICRELFPLFQPYGVPDPEIRIRAMTSCWGVCHPKKGSITLNRRLLETPRGCMEYVVLHELAHFVHPNHSRAFYDLLTLLMADWRKRKEELGKYAVFDRQGGSEGGYGF